MTGTRARDGRLSLQFGGCKAPPDLTRWEQEHAPWGFCPRLWPYPPIWPQDDVRVRRAFHSPNRQRTSATGHYPERLNRRARRRSRRRTRRARRTSARPVNAIPTTRRASGRLIPMRLATRSAAGPRNTRRARSMTRTVSGPGSLTAAPGDGRPPHEAAQSLEYPWIVLGVAWSGTRCQEGSRNDTGQNDVREASRSCAKLTWDV